MRIRSIEMLQRPLEENLLAGCTCVIRKIWENESIPASQAAELSEWVWRNVSPSPSDWLAAGAGLHERSAAWHASAKHFAELLLPMAVMEQRDEHFRDWVERAVMAPLMPANDDFVGAVASEVREEIERFCSESESEVHPAQIAEYLCNRQPPSVRTRLLLDQDFGDRFSLTTRQRGDLWHFGAYRWMAAIRRRSQGPLRQD